MSPGRGGAPSLAPNWPLILGMGAWALGYLGIWTLGDGPDAAPFWRVMTLVGPFGFVLAVRAARSSQELRRWAGLGAALATFRLLLAGPKIMAILAPSLPRGQALLVWAIFPLWDALPWVGFAFALRVALRHCPRAVPWVAATGAVAIELLPRLCHWAWAGPLVGWPLFARAAALVGGLGITAILWFAGAAGAMAASVPFRGWGTPTGAAQMRNGLLLLVGLALGARFLPEGPEQRRDIVVVQPVLWPENTFNPILPTLLWMQIDQALERDHLPREGRPLLVVWPEGSVRGSSRYGPPEDVEVAAKKRRVAVAIGTVGDQREYAQDPPVAYHDCKPLRSAVYLVGDEVAPQTYVRTHLFPWTEHVPLPTAAARGWVNDYLHTLPHESGPSVVFEWQGLRMGPVLCGEAMEPLRMWSFSGKNIDLILNPSNGTVFGDQAIGRLQGSIAGLQAIELGVPAVLANNTGPSGIAHADGEIEFWGERGQTAIWSYGLDWRTVHTPFRHPWYAPALVAALLLGLVAALLVPSGER